MFEKWKRGFEYLHCDDLYSYYSFFTVIFAEIAFLWSQNIQNHKVLTFVLLGCVVNVLVIAFLKGCYLFDNKRAALVLGIIYVAIYICLLILARFYSGKMTFILFAIPFIWTVIIKVLNERRIWLLWLPLGVFAFFVGKTELNWCWQLALIFLSIIFAPIWACIEDGWATQDIFELIYETY